MLDKLVRGRIANFLLEVGAETLSDGVGAMTIREDAQAAAVVGRDCAARRDKQESERKDRDRGCEFRLQGRMQASELRRSGANVAAISLTAPSIAKNKGSISSFDQDRVCVAANQRG